MPWRGVKPKRAQLELMAIVHLSLDLRELRHSRLELLARDDARRSIQLPLDARERGRRTTVPAPASVAEDASALVCGWLWGW